MALGKPVVVVASGGKPVVNTPTGQPAVVGTSLGQPITIVPAIGTPMALLASDGSDYAAGSQLSFAQVSPISTSITATFPGGLTANDLVIYVHRWTSGGNPPQPPTGFTDIDTYTPGGSSGDIAWGLGTAGATTITGQSGNTSNRSVAVAYRGWRSDGVIFSKASATGTGTAVTFPTLTLLQPGRSWVVGVVICVTAGTASATTAASWRAGSGIASNFLNVVDSNGAASSWSGKTLTLGTSSAWYACSIEIISA